MRFHQEMMLVDSYEGKESLTQWMIFLATCFLALPISYLIEQAQEELWYVPFIVEIGQYWPRFSAEAGRLASSERTAYLTGAYVLSNIGSVLLVPYFFYRVLRRTESGIDFSSAKKIALRPDFLPVWPFAILAIILLQVFYTGFGTDQTRIANGVMGSPFVLVWVSINYGMLSTGLTRSICSWRAWQLQRQ